jgi:hypothetical protein
MITKFYIENYASIGDGVWTSTVTEVTDAFDVKVNHALGNTKDTFSFKVPNNRQRNTYSFRTQDNIKIYYLINGATPSSDNLVLSGLVKSVSESVNESSNYLNIEGVSFGEITGNALVFYTGTNVTVRDIIITAVASVKIFNGNFGLEVDMPTTLPDGSSFPVVNSGGEVREQYRSLNYILEKYLKAAYTGGYNYYYYVDNSVTVGATSQLVIRPRFGSVNNSIVEGTTIINSAKITMRSDDVKNYVIVKCGTDYNNRPITARADDPVSRAKYGFRYYMLIDEKIAGDIKAKYPDLPNALYSTNGEFVSDIRNNLGKKRGESYIAELRNGLLTMDVSVPPSLNYALGNKVSCTFASYNLTNKELRIKDITYTLNSINLTLVEEVII